MATEEQHTWYEAVTGFSPTKALETAKAGASKLYGKGKELVNEGIKEKNLLNDSSAVVSRGSAVADKGPSGHSVGQVSNQSGGSLTSNPFETPEVQAKVDVFTMNFALEQLRLLAGMQANDAFTLYVDAVNQVRAELLKDQEKDAKESQMVFEISIAMAIVVLTPLTNGAAAALAGEALTKSLKLALAKAEELVGKQNLTDEILDETATKAITRLAKNYTASDAQRIITTAATSFSKKISIAGSSGEVACTLAYVKELKDAAVDAKSQKNVFISTAMTYSQLLQVYYSFLPAQINNYYPALSKQVSAFRKNIAPAIVKSVRLKAAGEEPRMDDRFRHGLSDGDNIVRMDAYGRIRYATIEFWAATITAPMPRYFFKSWVPPEAEAAAAAVAIRQLDPKLIEGHIPDPGVP